MDNSDILRPELVWIDRRCYRFNDSGSWSNDRGTATYQEESMYLEDDRESDDNNSHHDDIDVEQVDRSKFKHSFYVAKRFQPFLVGTKGSTRKRLENETSTTITIPRMGQDGNVVLTGPSRNKVILARSRIDELIKTFRNKLAFTAFVAVPMNGEGVQTEFEKFKKSVLETDPPIRGVDELIFQNPKKLHLTVTMLLVVDNDEEQKAVEALKHCGENIIDPIVRKNGPIKLTMLGVDYMNDDPLEVNVLYSKVEDTDGVLQDIANKMRDHFVAIGLSRKEYENVKLHVTLMNTMNRITNTDSPAKKRETFDATKILKDHRDTKFGEFVLNTLQICQRRTTARDGYYELIGDISV